MKKISLFLLVFCLSSLLCYSQTKKNIENNQIKNELLDSIDRLNKRVNDIETKLVLSDTVFKSKFNALTKAIDTTNKSIDDTRLRESLKSAESIINHLNTLVDSFAVIYGIISVIIILLTVGLPIIIQQLSIKPMKDEIKADHANIASEIEKVNELKILLREKQIDLEQKVHNSIQKFDSEKNIMLSDVKRELDSKFQEYLNKNKKERIDQALINLAADETDFQNSAISFLNLTAISDFEEEHLFKIFKTIKKTSLDFDKKISLAKILSDIKCEFSEDFFLSLPQDQALNNKEIRYYAYLYFAKDNISKYEEVCTKLVLSAENPTEEYKKLIGWYASYYDSAILVIINWSNLNSSKEIKTRDIVEKLKEWHGYTKNKDIIEKSSLFNETVS